MKKYIIILIFLFLLIFVINCSDNETSEYKEEENDDYEDFRKTLKEYLSEHNLSDSDQLIKPKRMRKIFLSIVYDLDVEGIPEYIKNAYEQLADYFIEKYYSKKKEIRVKDVYKLFNFDDITKKFNELIKANPDNGEDDNLKDMKGQNITGDL